LILPLADSLVESSREGIAEAGQAGEAKSKDSMR